MILEGLVTTTDAAGRVNLAPLGTLWPDDRPELGDPPGNRFTVRPYRGSRTCANLLATGRGVWHVTDDAALLARCAAGLSRRSAPPLADGADPPRLADCCRWLAFETVERGGPDDRGMYELRAAVTDRGTVRPARGLNRASHALVEAAILLTRAFLFERREIDRRLADLAPLVAKTGTADDLAAWAELRAAFDVRPAKGEGGTAEDHGTAR